MTIKERRRDEMKEMKENENESENGANNATNLNAICFLDSGQKGKEGMSFAYAKKIVLNVIGKKV